MKNSKKRLERRSAKHMFPPPNAKFAAENNGDEVSGGKIGVQFFAQNFLKFIEKVFRKKFRKSIDEEQKKIPDGSLSSTRKLFEIYFVRLIGTPNQNSKVALAERLTSKVSSSS